MLRYLAVTLVLFPFGQALAIDGACVTKQKNAASYRFANEVVIPVQLVKVEAFEPGAWTAGESNNVGSDTVLVRAANRNNRGTLMRRYVVMAAQIGATDDCDIVRVDEAQD